ncbi:MULTISPECIES: hypothetical protein [unclassified Actinopolyspora]|uniref:hypothetical protein n=1 Tax=unclassified Actinopolyspora TaxID=2639451 RepID=UPI0013F5C6EE|nr:MULTISPECIES: hypothetical protein [unclassified Actinopolyspora]NHD19421.1 hypothetical protein [Actinopolyspora sp. BKK2]NHE78506.1 hypothetical protein [Actinopolyspora sp. BKK1]
MARAEISGETWAVIGPLLPPLGELDRPVSIDSMTVRVHQHGAPLVRDAEARSNCKKLGLEQSDHAIGRFPTA